MTTNGSLASEGGHPGLYDIHINSFLKRLRAEGYAKRTLRKKRSVVACFARWIEKKRLAVSDIDESHLSSFVKRSPMKKARADFETAVLRLFLRYLRAEAVCSSPPSGEVDPAQPYVDYLRKERGLAKNSILVYAPFVRDFLTYASPETLDAQVIQDFLLDRIRNRSSEYARLLTVALRSFLRFLHLRGEAPTDFSSAVPMVRKWSQARITPFLSPDEVEHIISGTSCGRDRAILLLLARLGLRAGEVVALELGDILWRSGEIVIRGKGRMQDRLPLLEDVGEALALYIRDDRSASSSRRVFLRVYAPRVGLAGPAAVGHVVRLALGRAGLHPDRGAAHLFPSQHRDEDDPSWRVDRRDIGGPPASIHGHHPDLHEGGFRVTADCCPTLAGRRRMTIHEALARYIAIRRSLGSRLREPAMTLGHFVDLLEREGMDFITTDIAVRWAQESQGVQRATWSRRLSMVRQFAAWLHPFDPRTEVPPKRLLYARHRRNKPHIYTDREIERLMAEASRLPSPKGLRAPTYVTLIGLLVSCGLRPGEALALDIGDVDLENGILAVRCTKFGKSRCVPIGDTTRAALARYAKIRDGRCPSTTAFLVSERGGMRLDKCIARRTFAKLSCIVGLRAPTGSRRIGRGPRLQDMRHPFATQKLIEWYREGLDVARELPKLSTYLGHVDVSNTYWYIEAVPELLSLATERASEGGAR